MLLSFLDLLQTDPIAWASLLFVTVLGVVSAVTVHEAAHAWSALQLGDRTAAMLGRVTLNPRAHLDPAGSLLFLITFFGWGKPTPVNPANLRGNVVSASALVSFSGPGANLLSAVIFAAPFRAGLLDWHPPFAVIPFTGAGVESAVADVLAYGVLFNVILAIFNLIPLPPLDGFKVAVGILPREMGRTYSKLERYGAGPLVALLLLELVTPVDILSEVLVPFANFVIDLLTGSPFPASGVS